MTPSWMAAGPIVRRLLVLATHRWILEQDLASMSDAAAIDRALAPDGSLARRLAAFVPIDEAARWRRFIALVVGDLRSALARPPDKRDAAWFRWLFLIPYSVPTPPPPPDPRPAAWPLTPAAGGS
jgi:hypothetical protein